MPTAVAALSPWAAVTVRGQTATAASHVDAKQSGHIVQYCSVNLRAENETPGGADHA